MKIRPLIFLSALSFMLLGLAGGLRAQQPDTGPAARKVIIFVWDGLRTDDLTPEITPNYFALARSGVVFADHHAVYPTFTMMNSASIATGTYPGAAWILWQRGVCAAGEGKERERGRYRFFRAGVHRRFWRGGSGARALPGQAHACFDDATSRTSQRADDSGCRQVRRRLHPGLQARRDHPRRRRGDAAWFCQGTATGRLLASAEQQPRV